MKRENFYPVVLALLWGLNWPAVKIVLSEVPVFVLRSSALAIASVLLLSAALLLRRSLVVARGSWLPLALAGALNIAAFNIFTAFAQLNTTTSRAAILTYTMPVWSTLLAALVLREPIGRDKAIALMAGAAGVTLLAAPVFAAEEFLGVILSLLAALAWAIGIVIQKKWPIAGDPVATTGYQLLIGAVISVVCLLVTRPALPEFLSLPVFGAFLFHVAGATSAAYLLWFTILDRNSASTSALLSFAVPVVGVLSAMLLVGDRPSPADTAGFAAILLAAGLAMRSSRNRDKSAPETSRL
ncbi:EamA family transporter [Nordella sp. HKS 07]|uniref:DMT family transporter n=1 Tax=Nordella sp. HKS 07 TaxID=2712222 RepID=UPI0013E1FFE0|nr:EamA family transporter [Nordella sp. HKS 07]QIG47636.1 EamA family transporter [Nordella sp. HKS 07]